MSLPAFSWFELSFLHGGHSRRTAFRALGDPLPQLRPLIQEAWGRYMADWPGAPNGLDVVRIDPGFLPGPPTDLLDAIARELGLDRDPSIHDPQEMAQWQAIRALARALPTPSHPQPMLVDFVWENGGDDDNLFSDGFAFDPAHATAAHALSEALGQWGEEHGHWYEFQAVANPGLGPLAGRMDVAQLTQFLASPEGPGLPDEWRNLCRFVLALDAQAGMENTLVAPPPPRHPGPRL